MDIFRIPLAGSHEAVNQPGLTADLSGHPAGGVGDIRQRQAKHDDPKDPARFIQFLAPKQERCCGHHGDEDCPQSGHDVIAVIEQRDIRGPLVFGKFIQAFYLGGGSAIDQEAQNFVDHQGIVNAPMLFIGLAQYHYRRAVLRLEEAFHRSSGHGLVTRHVFAMKVARGKDLQRGENYARNYSHAHKHARVVCELSF